AAAGAGFLDDILDHQLAVLVLETPAIDVDVFGIGVDIGHARIATAGAVNAEIVVEGAPAHRADGVERQPPGLLRGKFAGLGLVVVIRQDLLGGLDHVEHLGPAFLDDGIAKHHHLSGQRCDKHDGENRDDHRKAVVDRKMSHDGAPDRNERSADSISLPIKALLKTACNLPAARPSWATPAPRRQANRQIRSADRTPRRRCAGGSSTAIGVLRDRPTIHRIPPICGSNASRTRRSMAKSLLVGRSMPRLAQATTRIAASVCGSAVCSTECMAMSTACRRSATAASRSLQNLPTPPLHSRSRAAIASASAAWATVTAGVTRE